MQFTSGPHTGNPPFQIFFFQCCKTRYVDCVWCPGKWRFDEGWLMVSEEEILVSIHRMRKQGVVTIAMKQPAKPNGFFLKDEQKRCHNWRIEEQWTVKETNWRTTNLGACTYTKKKIDSKNWRWQQILERLLGKCQRMVTRWSSKLL